MSDMPPDRAFTRYSKDEERRLLQSLKGNAFKLAFAIYSQTVGKNSRQPPAVTKPWTFWASLTRIGPAGILRALKELEGKGFIGWKRGTKASKGESAEVGVIHWKPCQNGSAHHYQDESAALPKQKCSHSQDNSAFHSGLRSKESLKNTAVKNPTATTVAQKRHEGNSNNNGNHADGHAVEWQALEAGLLRLHWNQYDTAALVKWGRGTQPHDVYAFAVDVLALAHKIIEKNRLASQDKGKKPNEILNPRGWLISAAKAGRLETSDAHRQQAKTLFTSTLFTREGPPSQTSSNDRRQSAPSRLQFDIPQHALQRAGGLRV